MEDPVLMHFQQSPLKNNLFAKTMLPPEHTRKLSRVVVYPKDVVNITGLGDRAARKLIQKLKSGLGKSKNMFVTAQEFSICTGIPEELVTIHLK